MNPIVTFKHFVSHLHFKHDPNPYPWPVMHNRADSGFFWMVVRIIALIGILIILSIFTRNIY